MSKTHYTIGEITKAITGGNERAARKMINDAGMTPRLDEYKIEPGELIPRDVLIELLADNAGSRTGRKAAELLRQ